MRDPFRIQDLAVYYGEFGASGVSNTQARDWGFDTLVVTNRKALNGTSTDTAWAANELDQLVDSPSRDVLAYINVAKADFKLDRFTGSNADGPWKGALTGVPGEDSVFYANYWEPSWLAILKQEVDAAIAAGADGLFLDDVDRYFNVSSQIGQNAIRMVELVVNLSAYARQQAGSDFRIIVNSSPYLMSDAVFGAGGSPDPSDARSNAFISSVNGIMRESLYDTGGFNVPVLQKLQTDWLAKGVSVIVVDNMRTSQGIDAPDAAATFSGTAGEYGFTPVLVNSIGQTDLPDYTSIPRLDGSGLNRATAANDTITGGPLGDTLAGLNGNDIIRGGNGNDQLNGGAGSDFVLGEAGDDVIFMTYGDSAYGGLGNDTFVFTGGPSPASFIALGDDGFDTVDFSAMTGGISWNTATNERGIGTAFADNMSASVFAVGRWFSAGLGNDTLTGFDGSDRLEGEGGNDFLNGAGGADILFGGDGTDRLSGGQGNDTLWAGLGDDIALGDAGDDIMFGEAGADGLGGGDGLDTLYGWEGADTLFGDAGNDLLFGEQDGDLLYGWLGADVLWGGGGNDSLWGEQDNDTLLGETGDDILLGIDGSDVMYGWLGADTLYGWTGDDVLWGEGGNDLMLGEDGADVFIGGLGRDTMTGGVGADRFFNANFEIAAGEVDLITDYDAADRYLFQQGAQIQYFNFNAPGYGTGAGIHVQVAGGVFILDVFGATAQQLQNQTQFF